jgi:hypothetical protein
VRQIMLLKEKVNLPVQKPFMSSCVQIQFCSRFNMNKVQSKSSSRSSATRKSNNGKVNDNKLNVSSKLC